MKHFSSLSFLIAATLLASCADEKEDVKPPAAKVGTLVVDIKGQDASIARICYDISLKDGANALVGEKKRECVGSEQAFTWSNPCSAEPGRLTHAATVSIVAAYLTDGTAVSADPTGPGDLAEVVNPCPNGCILQTSCEHGKERRISFDLNVVEKTHGGFVDVTVAPVITAETAPADAPVVLCYSLTVEDGAGKIVATETAICDDVNPGEGTHSLDFQVPCDGRADRNVNKVSLGLTSVFTEARTSTGGDPGPGLRGEYSFTCDASCIKEVTCTEGKEIAVAFTPTIGRVYPVGLANVVIATTVTGDEAEPVGGGCYTIIVANSQGEELVNQATICSAFHSLPDGGPAGLSYAAQCDSTPWATGGATHTVSVIVESLYGADNAPSANGVPPANRIEGLTNPCPAEAP